MLKRFAELKGTADFGDNDLWAHDYEQHFSRHTHCYYKCIDWCNILHYNNVAMLQYAYCTVVFSTYHCIALLLYCIGTVLYYTDC